ncbi:uncharacterized protein LOC102675851 isoform X4 [Apis dorsata]|nr:uncharacterized protein LOC102675851 isoform X4 [Apis dorsata]
MLLTQQIIVTSFGRIYLVERRGEDDVICSSSICIVRTHTLQMNRTFNAFQMTQKPQITSYRKHIRLKKSMILPDDTLEYWGFYLLKGASVALSVCSRFQGASILVVKGERNLRTCGMLEHHNTQILKGIFLPKAKEQVKVTFKSNTEEINSSNNITQVIYNNTLNNIEDKLLWNITSYSGINHISYEKNHDKESKKLIQNENIQHYIKSMQKKNIYNTRKLRHIKKKQYKEQIKEIRKNKILQERKKIQKKIKIKSYLKKYKNEKHNFLVLKKLQKKLNLEDNIEDNIKKKMNMQDKILKRKIRNQEIVKPTFLLDQGVKHGGNAGKNATNIDHDSSISSFETDLFKCYGGSILIAQEFTPSEQCTNVTYLLNSKHMQAVHNVVENGYYYYIFYSDNDIISNDIYALFDIYKPVFHYENITKSCINQTNCSFSINLLSSDRVIVEIPTKDDFEYEMNEANLLLSICHPRMEVYIIFPVAVLFFILACAFM